MGSHEQQVFLDFRPYDNGLPIIGEVVPGAVIVPFEYLANGKYRDLLNESLDIHYIAFCIKGIRSAIATSKLAEDGYSVSDGGSYINAIDLLLKSDI